MALSRARSPSQAFCQAMRGLCFADPRITPFNALRAPDTATRKRPLHHHPFHTSFPRVRSPISLLPAWRCRYSHQQHLILHINTTCRIHDPLHSLPSLSAPLSLFTPLASALLASRSGTSQNPRSAPLWREPHQGRSSWRYMHSFLVCPN